MKTKKRTIEKKGKEQKRRRRRRKKKKPLPDFNFLLPYSWAREVSDSFKKTGGGLERGWGWGGGGEVRRGEHVVPTCLTNIFNNILKTKQIPDSLHEAKIVILFKNGDPKDINK